MTDDNHHMPRRALLAVPFAAAAGMFVLWARKERALPDAAASGSGSVVTLVLFADSGERTGVAQVRKLVESDTEWRAELSADEYSATRKNGTERPYTGRYWNNHEAGLYRCVCCGSAVFQSTEKFDSDTGWPSFWAPVAAENIVTSKDTSLAEERLAVSCRKCDAHLGHVFNDGPPPTGLRYCMNSIALRFVRRY